MGERKMTLGMLCLEALAQFAVFRVGIHPLL